MASISIFDYHLCRNFEQSKIESKRMGTRQGGLGKLGRYGLFRDEPAFRAQDHIRQDERDGTSGFSLRPSTIPCTVHGVKSPDMHILNKTGKNGMRDSKPGTAAVDML